jgi:hypothetical protein
MKTLFAFTIAVALFSSLAGNARADQAPTVTAPVSRTVIEGSPLLFGVTASDADGDSIFAFTGSGTAITAGAHFNSNATHTAGNFLWTPHAGQAGTYSVTFTASNALSGFATTTIIVTSSDRPPVVTAPATANGRELAQFSFNVTASDPDGDPITQLSASGTALNAGGSFTTVANHSSGTFTWTPNLGQAGDYSVTFTATNAQSASTTTSITISPPDNPPTVTGVAAEDTVAEGSPLTINVLATDPDGQPMSSLVASGSAMSAGATFQTNPDNSVGVFNWTPGYNQAGTWDVKFLATANGLSDSAMATITVTNTDRPPRLSSVPATFFAEESHLISFPIGALDPDGDAITSLTASGTAIDAGGTFSVNPNNAGGTFSWTPAVGQAGSYRVTFTATNALAFSASTDVSVVGFTTTDLVTTTPRVHSGVVFPLKVTDASLAAILVPQLGPSSDPTLWRLGRWSPTDSTYLSADAGTLLSVDPGYGYWIATKDAKTIHMSGYPQTQGKFFLPILDGPGGRPGWNQMGNPYSSAISVDQLGVSKGPAIKLLTAADNTWTSRSVWIYQSSTETYDSTTVQIPPLGMFWVKKIESGEKYLVVSHPGTALAQAAPPEAAPRVDWDLTLTARQEANGAFPVTMGVAAVAPEGWSPLDLALPPNAPGRMLRLAIPKSDWGRMNDDYASEYRTPAARLDWNLAISGMETPGELRLALSGRNLPVGLRVRITDLDRGASWEMAPGQEVPLAAIGEIRRLRLTATLDGAPLPPAGATAFDAYPNPSRGEIGFVARLDRRSDVSVEILDVAGRRVRMLSRHDAPYGENVLVWDGRDDSGAAAAPGLYLARYRAGAISATTRIVRIR